MNKDLYFDEANHGNDGDGYAIITFIGDKID